MPHIQRHPRIEAMCGLIAVAIACAFVGGGVVTFALSRLRTPVLHVALASRLAADYSEQGAGAIAPIDPSIILSVDRDDKPPIATKGKARFAPIFESATGSQLPGAPPASAQAATSPTPSPATTETVVTATAVTQSTPTPSAGGGSPATRTPAPQSGVPQPTDTPPPATSTPLPQATPTSPGQGGGPKATNTPTGQGGSSQATNTPGHVGGPKATKTPPGPAGGSTATKTPKP